MSNYKAIAVVTAALRNRLSNVCTGVLSAATVTTLRPDISATNLPTAGVNLFLYQVTPNAALRNSDLPTRRSDGTVIKHPIAAIDLHYLFSFYGNDANFETQMLLGSVVGNLHAEPTLSRSDIEGVFSASALGTAADGGVATPGDLTISELTVPNQAALSDPSGLADAVDLVRFTPTELSLEELSKLWSVFLDTPYVLSFIYQAGPVLIEDTSATPTAAALPVMLPARVHALSAVQPTVTQVFPNTGPGQPIVANSTLSVTGIFLAGVSTTVLIDGAAALVLTPTVTQTITGVPIPASFPSGAHSVQITQQLITGDPNRPTQQAVSNLAGFVLQPTITVTPALAADSARTVTVNVTPAVAAHQTVRLLFNLLNPPSPPTNVTNPLGIYVLETIAPQTDGATSFAFATKGLTDGDLPTGTYLARIQIDGVESPLTFVPPPKPGTAASGQTGFTGPTVILT
jgi:hypothetical protein